MDCSNVRRSDKINEMSEKNIKLAFVYTILYLWLIRQSQFFRTDKFIDFLLFFKAGFVMKKHRQKIYIHAFSMKTYFMTSCCFS